MSQISINNDFWLKRDNERLLIGFNSSMLSRLGQIWNFIPRIQPGQSVLLGQPFATVETTTSLMSLMCPISGVVLEINPELDSNPEEISEHTMLFTIKEEINEMSVLQ